DEIGDMPIEAQTRLLRVLQQGEFTTVGGSRTIRADVRIVAATNRDVRQAVARGAFREDLYYRLNVVPVVLPALRERRQDVGALARHFLERAAESGLPRKMLDDDAVDVLEAHDWPGNVRELENLMRRLAALSRDDRISAGEIREMLGEPATALTSVPAAAIDDAVRAYIDRLARTEPKVLDDGTLYDRLIAEVERPLIEAMLARFGGNQLRAARAMGLNRNTLRKRLDMLGIDPAPRSPDR
ncbi:MAG: sigma 54-interacting transcriptional regulator, partial [Proteobacteria bacterium]|nr:sigma 54-interacting transcriptional regulator [Pseudomonadota bacterium]